ncbi:serine hydrolase [Paenibacillus sp. NPDC058071]|uniref:serine hydrolase n=1 Tax=Paenibacillus sp. NPDC058071 TaxID=3346326 RepID=UPI0036DB1E4A
MATGVGRGTKNAKRAARLLIAAAVLAGPLSGVSAWGGRLNVAEAASAAEMVKAAKVIVDGKESAGWSAKPFVAGGTTYVPLREAAASLGAKVTWNNATKSARMELNGDIYVYQNGVADITLNDGFRLRMPAASRTVNGSLMVPLRALTDAMRSTLKLTQTPSLMTIEVTTDNVTTVDKKMAAVDRYLIEQRYSGLALVAKDGRVLLRKGYGLASPGKLNRPDMTSRIASITKSFTAAAVMKLVEEGKLSLNDPISAYITGIPRGDEITIHMLLSHTSGLPSEFTRGAERTIEQTVAEIRTKKLEFEPGTDYKYSNNGYVLLAAVIEKLSGQSYAAYVQSELMSRAGMSRSGTATKSTPVIQGYVQQKGEWVEAPYYVSQSGTGTLYATVDDLLKWDGLLRSGKLLTADSLEAMYTPHSEKGYGYGWIARDAAEGRTVFHNGSGSGYSTGMSRNLDNGLTVILLGNRAGMDTALLMEHIQTIAAKAVGANG